MDDAVRLHDLAVSRWAEGRSQEAVPLCWQALALVEHAVGRQHPDVANVLNTLAGLYADLGNYDEAERLAQRSVAMMEGVTGDVELEVLRVQSLGTLAGLYRVQGRYAEAEALYQRALRWGEAALGPRHPKVLTCRRNYAQLLRETQRKTEALAMEACSRRGRKRQAPRSRAPCQDRNEQRRVHNFPVTSERKDDRYGNTSKPGERLPGSAQ